MQRNNLINKIGIFLILMFLISFGVFAQESNEPIAILEYFDDEYEIEILDADNMLIDEYAYFGMPLYTGYTINTNGSTAEIRLDPNGSALKLTENTVLLIESFQKDLNTSNNFALLGGKLRAIAAKSQKGGDRYNIRTQSAVCGVRGTDWITTAVGQFIVKNGLVEIKSLISDESVILEAGMFLDAMADAFTAIKLSAEELAEQYADVVFKGIDTSIVPGQEPEPEAETEEKEPEIFVEAAVVPEAPKEPEPAAEAEPEIKAPGPFDAFFDKLGDVLGMEIGTVTIDGTTYSKALLQPEFSIGKLKMSLYLPIIYNTDMFDPEDWYHPKGNNEWSFGTDEEYEGEEREWLYRTEDFMSDLMLKIRYLEWGKQRDPFFFKIGNLNNMTLGHGILMNNYANDADFPAIRKIGFNIGLDFGKIGFEGIVNDLSTIPNVFGTRIYFRPFYPFRLAFGVSAAADIDPAGELEIPETYTGDIEKPAEYYGSPVFINPALDFDMPIIETDFLSIVIFGDAAGMIPYFKSSPEGHSGITPGFIPNALFTKEEESVTFRNYGLMTGLFGNILIADYRLEYRNYNGIFKPGFYSTAYDRIKGHHVEEIIIYLENPDAPEYQNSTSGIYGQLGFLIKDTFTLEGGYMWPWSKESGFVPEDDVFILNASIEPDIIPVLGIYGSVSYTRYGLAYGIEQTAQEGVEFELFDVNTVVKGEIIYPIAPTLDIALLFTTAISRNPDGTVIYDENGDSSVYTTISFDTKIHF